MRTVISHTFATLDGVATPEMAEEDAMLLGPVTYQRET